MKIHMELKRINVFLPVVFVSCFTSLLQHVAGVVVGKSLLHDNLFNFDNRENKMLR